jgi:hypothetical protein
MSMLLRALASSKTMVPNDDDREILAEAADILRERLVLSHGLTEPHVVIVQGVDHDPVAWAVDELQEHVRRVADELLGLDDKIDGIRRDLRQASKAAGA